MATAKKSSDVANEPMDPAGEFVSGAESSESLHDADPDVQGESSTADDESHYVNTSPEADDESHYVNTSPEADDEGDYVYIQVGGDWRRVRKEQIYTGQGGTFDPVAPPKHAQDFYVHLANGDVERVNGADLPPAAGAGNPNGFFEKDGKVHHVIGVYEVESDIDSKGDSK